MNYVFFGTPEFAAIILRKLIDAGLVPAAVVCNPDKPKGRKKILTAPAVKQAVEMRNEKLERRIEILQPETSPSLVSHLSSLKPDVFIVASYAHIIPKEVLSIPKLGVIGVHPSLLPKYRGPSPIQTAILEGETETGVTLYLVDEEVDHGPVLAKSKIQIANCNYENLLKKLAELGGELLVETLPKFLEDTITPKEQNHVEVTLTKKFNADDGFVPPESLKHALENKDAAEPIFLFRKILALNPEPGVWTIADDELKIENYELRIPSGKRVKLLEAKMLDGKLVLTKIQVEGEKPRPLKQ